MTGLLTTQILKKAVNKGLLIYQLNRNNDVQQALITYPGSLPEVIGEFYSEEMKNADAELTTGAISKVSTRYQTRQVGYIPQEVRKDGGYGVILVRDNQGHDQSGMVVESRHCTSVGFRRC